ncbi:unnamed protein product [Kuraishia capsulata CBS 1993]|uniref:Zn(2)-C6 fungal-type domain-containing protein n=1 Tax=Kuraishia capsulata CBS 1993 TaxID=1382522 RepID=W6MJ94_9ASCO|nr:uncharacterized protein KUCA_T00001989001 [Kuraishia capsulata CBS 1993]CDK26018.1 unnamed protein product [Kuraishia capsulata CBS 1993]
MAMTVKEKKTRRKYSRNGCMACKKRKIKCDEGTPVCGRCDHLKINCLYHKQFKFKDITHEVRPPSELENIELDRTADEPIEPEITTNVEILNLFESAESIIGDMAGITNGSNLQNVVRMGEELEYKGDMDVPFENRLSRSPLEMVRTSSAESNGLNLSTFADYDYLKTLESSLGTLEISRLAKWLQFRPDSSRLVHFRAFMIHVNLILFPLTCSYADSPCIMVILEAAKRCKFLLSAVLASGASFLGERAKIGLRNCTESQRKRLETEIEEHESSRIYYLSQCFALLQQVLEDMVQVTDYVDGILLTSLILAADSSSRKDSRWKVHLQGAKQFLIRYSNEVRISDALIISRYIFSSLEISSGLNAPLGGSLHSAEELDNWITIRSDSVIKLQLYRLGLTIDGHITNQDGQLVCSEGSYNMYVGYSDHSVEVLKEMLRAFNEIRNLQMLSPGKDVQLDPRAVSMLFAKIERARGFRIVTNKPPFRIPLESKFHPAYVGADKTRLPLSCYYRITNPKLRMYIQEDECWFSFYDFLQQIHLDGIYLRILTCKEMMNVPYNSSLVQAVVKDMIDELSFFIQLDYESVTDQDLLYLEEHYNSKVILSKEDIKLFESRPTSSDLAAFSVPEKKLRELMSASPPIDYVKYVNLQVDHRLCMFQWILLACGFCCVEPHHKLLVETLLSELNELGVRSSAKSLEKVRRAWLERRFYYDDGSRVVRKDINTDFFWRDEENSFPFT